MTCTAMLYRMLEAEMDELSGAGDSPLATHLRECESCRAMARRILSDTTILAFAVAPRVMVASPRRTGVQRRRVALGLAAATLLAVVGHQWSSRVAPPVAPPARYATTASATAPPTPATKDPSEPSPRRHGSGEATTKRRGSVTSTRTTRVTPTLTAIPVTNTPVLVASFEPPVAVVPVRIDAPAQDPLGSTVAVHPPAGTRADIRRTANPSVTVVWLYR